MAFLDRKALLKKRQFKIEKVDFEDGDHTFAREMSAHEKDVFNQSLYVINEDEEGEVKTERAMEDFRAKLVVCTACTESGVLLFEPEDYKTLSHNMTATMIEAIVNVAERLNAISKKDRKNMLKNSAGAQSADSSSDSAKS